MGARKPLRTRPSLSVRTDALLLPTAVVAKAVPLMLGSPLGLAAGRPPLPTSAGPRHAPALPPPRDVTSRSAAASPADLTGIAADGGSDTLSTHRSSVAPLPATAAAGPKYGGRTSVRDRPPTPRHRRHHLDKGVSLGDGGALLKFDNAEEVDSGSSGGEGPREATARQRLAAATQPAGGLQQAGSGRASAARRRRGIPAYDADTDDALRAMHALPPVHVGSMRRGAAGGGGGRGGGNRARSSRQAGTAQGSGSVAAGAPPGSAFAPGDALDGGGLGGGGGGDGAPFSPQVWSEGGGSGDDGAASSDGSERSLIFPDLGVLGGMPPDTQAVAAAAADSAREKEDSESDSGRAGGGDGTAEAGAPGGAAAAAHAPGVHGSDNAGGGQQSAGGGEGGTAAQAPPQDVESSSVGTSDIDSVGLSSDWGSSDDSDAAAAAHARGGHHHGGGAGGAWDDAPAPLEKSLAALTQRVMASRLPAAAALKVRVG